MEQTTDKMIAYLDIDTKQANKLVEDFNKTLTKVSVTLNGISKTRTNSVISKSALTELNLTKKLLMDIADLQANVQIGALSMGQAGSTITSLAAQVEERRRAAASINKAYTFGTDKSKLSGENVVVPLKEQNKIIKDLTTTYSKLQGEMTKTANAVQYYSTLGTTAAKKRKEELTDYYNFLNKQSRTVDPMTYMASGDTSLGNFTRAKDAIDLVTSGLQKYTNVSKLANSANIAESFKTASPYILQTTKELERFVNLSTGLERTLNRSKLASDDSKNSTKNFISSLNVETEKMKKTLEGYDSAIIRAEQNKAKVYQDGRYGIKAQVQADAELLKLQKEKEDYINKQRIALSQYNQEAAKHRDLMSEQSGVKYWSALGARALAYYGIYQAITTLQSTAFASVQFLAEADTIARTFAALSDTKDRNEALKETQELTRDLISLNKQYGGTLKEIGQASLELKRAGTPEKDIVASTEAVIKLAALTGDTIAQSASALVTYTQVYGELAAQQGKVSYSTQEIGDKLAYMANQSRLSTQDIGTFSNYALATATQVGFTIDAINGMGIALTNAGFNASTAGTQVRKFASVLGDTSSATTKFFSTIGYNQKQLAADIAKGGEESNKAFINFLSYIRSINAADFTKSLEGMDLLQKNILQALRANSQQVTEALIGSINDAEGSINRANIITESYQKTAERLWATMLDGISSSIKPLADWLQRATIEFLDGGNAVEYYKVKLEALNKVRDKPKESDSSISKFIDDTRKAQVEYRIMTELLDSKQITSTDYNKFAGDLEVISKSLDKFSSSSIKNANTLKDPEKQVQALDSAIQSLSSAYVYYLDLYKDSPVVQKLLVDSLTKEVAEINKAKWGIEDLTKAKKELGIIDESGKMYQIISEQSTKDLQRKLSFIETILKNTKATTTESMDAWIKEVNDKTTTGISDLGRYLSKATTNLGVSDEDKNRISSWYSDLFGNLKPEDLQSVEVLSSVQKQVEDFLKTFEQTEGMSSFSTEIRTLVNALLVVASGSSKIDEIIRGNKENITKTANQLADAQKKQIELGIERNKILLEEKYRTEGLTSTQATYVNSIKDYESAQLELNKQLMSKAQLEKTLGSINGDDAKSIEARNKLLEVSNAIEKSTIDLKTKYLAITSAETKVLQEDISVRSSALIASLQHEMSIRTMLADIKYAEATLYNPMLSDSQAQLISLTAEDTKNTTVLTNSRQELAIAELKLAEVREKLAVEPDKNSSSYQDLLKEEVASLREVEKAQYGVLLTEVNLSNTRLRLREQEKIQTGSMYDGFNDYTVKYINTMMTEYEKGKYIADAMTSSMTSGFENFFDRTSDGYMKLGTLATSVLNDILKATLRATIINPLVGNIMGGLGSLFGGTTISAASEAAASSVASGGSLTDAYFGYAKGGAFASSSLSAYSSSIVDKPTPFMFAKGGALGVMGEAGAEAIMPLARNSSGELGVKVANQGTQNIKVEIKNESSQQMEVTSVKQSVDTEGIVLSIVVNGIQKNKMGLRDLVGGR